MCTRSTGHVIYQKAVSTVPIPSKNALHEHVGKFEKRNWSTSSDTVEGLQPTSKKCAAFPRWARI